MSNSIEFSSAFQALTGNEPFPWQRELYERLMAGNSPTACRIPTGLGKTAVISVWLIAVARLGRRTAKGKRLARRLVYVVNRRTVVDQATDEVNALRDRLLGRTVVSSEDRTVLDELRRSLESLCATDGDCLAISTLRGEMADNEEWKSDPSRPAIVLATVDMAGSRLLFSGYGDSFRRRSHHAGLLGQDTLIVHDEAHLEPAFQRLLTTIEEEQHRCGDPWPLRVMELTATSRGEEQNGSNTISLTAEDKKHAVVKRRINARKNLAFHTVDDEKKQTALKVAEIALGEKYRSSGKAILVFMRTLADVQVVAGELEKAKAEFTLLTGTIRGKERDELVETDIFRRFLRGTQNAAESSAADETVYLVCTSAGEVGVNISADHMVCDLSPLESMTQRFGRVNRFGDTEAHINVVHPVDFDEDADLDSKRKKTLGLLKQLPKVDSEHDASPAALTAMLGELRRGQKEAAFSPTPTILPATDILFDAWALTTVRDEMPGRPEVAPYLHGRSDYDPPQTYVAWRKEVELFAAHKVDNQSLAEWFDACPIAAHERLSGASGKVRETLRKLLEAHRKKQQADYDAEVVVLDSRGNGVLRRLSEIVANDSDIEYRTVVLPLAVGGLDSKGMLNPQLDAKRAEPNEQLDVAEYRNEELEAERRERWLVTKTEMARYDRLITEEAAESFPKGLVRATQIVLYEPKEEDGPGATCLVLGLPSKKQLLVDPQKASVRQLLDDHNALAAEMAESTVKHLGLDTSFGNAVVESTRKHDMGKDVQCWQRYACNDQTCPLAKSDKYLHARALGGYRHEFGTLLKLGGEDISASDRDLVLHLIAAHHGWARPHFKPHAGGNVGTTAENERTLVEVIQRFGRLQQRYGRWGLAYLESLVRAADARASIPMDASTTGDQS